MSRLVRALVVTVVAGLLAVFLTAGAAAATPRVDDPCLNNPSQLCDPPDPAQSELLPVNRWADSTGAMHGRLETFDFPEKVQRYGTYPVLMSVGNAMWSGATSMTSAAIRMDILDSAGQAADNAAAKLGRSLMTSGILALVAVIALIVPMWRAARGQGGSPWGQFGKVGAIVGLFAVMVVGAGNSTTSASGEFQPGAFSPGWWVVTTNNVIAQVASAPAAALTVGDAGAGFTYDESAKGELSCYQYVGYLKDRYQTSNPANRMESSVPLVMSGMWEATGLQVWATSQFGADNPYGDYSYCRLLEQFAGTPAAEQRSITLAASDDPVADANVSSLKSLAWETAENVQQDRTMVAWAVCRPNGSGAWNAAPGWGNISGTYRDGDGQVEGDCAEWWGSAASFQEDAGATFDDEDSAFEFKNAEVIYNDVSDTRARNYLLTLQGQTGGGVTSSLAMVYAYMFSSLVILVVFGVIALAIILAKVAALVMMIAVFFALLMALWPNSNKGSIGKYLGQYVGMALFVFGIQLVFAFMTLLTSMMVQAGADMFGGGAFITMIWTGFAPVVSVIVIHMVFVKFLKLPSPFSVTGAQHWGQAAAGGAIGGAVGAGVMNRLQRRGATMAMSGGRAAGRAMVSKATGGRFGKGRGAARAGMLTGAPATGAAAGGAAGARTETAKLVRARAGQRNGAAVQPEALDGAGVAAETQKLDRAARRRLATDAADERGAKNTVVGRYTEGLKARWSEIGQQFAGKSALGKTWQGTKGTVKTVAKVAGAGALVVGTGGMAVPVMAAVWGTKHALRVRAARGGAIDRFEAKKAADELAAAEAERKRAAADRAAGRAHVPSGASASVPPGAGAAHARAAARSNGESVRVPVRNPIPREAAPGQWGPAPVAVAVGGGAPPVSPAAPGPRRSAGSVEVTQPLPTSRRQAQGPRRGEKPFGRR